METEEQKKMRLGTKALISSELKKYSFLSSFMIELVVVVIYWTDCMPRKFSNEIRLPGTTGIDNLPIPLTMTLS